MTLETLLEIKAENDRFAGRLNTAINVAETCTQTVWNCETQSYSKRPYLKCEYCKEAGAVKRAALDLKAELTKITSPKY